MTVGRIALLALAVAAGIGRPAHALERPVPVANAAVPCPRYGPGFVTVPGTSSCVRISGRVRAEAGAGTGARRISRDDIVGPRASGRVSVDTRTDTDYGPVRTFMRVRAGQPGTGQ